MISPRNDGPMKSVRYVTHPLEKKECELFALEMRDADVRETVAALGIPVMRALQYMVDHVPIIRSVYYLPVEFVDRVPLAVYGLVRMSPATACPFMLGCNALEEHPIALQRYACNVLTRWKGEYVHLFNYVHAENETAIRWLESLGFQMQDPAPYGKKGELFRRFDWWSVN